MNSVKWRLNDGVSFAKFGENDDAVLLSLASGFLYRCNPTAALFIEGVTAGKELEGIVADFKCRYSVPEEEVRGDLAELAATLSRDGLRPRGMKTAQWLMLAHVAFEAQRLPRLSLRLPFEELLERYTPESVSPRYARLTASEIVDVINLWLRKPWRMRGRPCLRKGLLMFYWLRRAGYEPVLHFAVYAKRGPKAQAHCWVTLDGELLCEGPVGPHTVIFCHEGRRKAA